MSFYLGLLVVFPGMVINTLSANARHGVLQKKHYLCSIFHEVDNETRNHTIDNTGSRRRHCVAH